MLNIITNNCIFTIENEELMGGGIEDNKYKLFTKANGNTLLNISKNNINIACINCTCQHCINHTYIQIIDKEPTCIELGTYHYECSNCATLKPNSTGNIEKINHLNFTLNEPILYYCNNCNQSFDHYPSYEDHPNCYRLNSTGAPETSYSGVSNGVSYICKYTKEGHYYNSPLIYIIGKCNMCDNIFNIYIEPIILPKSIEDIDIENDDHYFQYQYNYSNEIQKIYNHYTYSYINSSYSSTYSSYNLPEKFFFDIYLDNISKENYLVFLNFYNIFSNTMYYKYRNNVFIYDNDKRKYYDININKKIVDLEIENNTNIEINGDFLSNMDDETYNFYYENDTYKYYGTVDKKQLLNSYGDNIFINGKFNEFNVNNYNMNIYEENKLKQYDFNLKCNSFGEESNLKFNVNLWLHSTPDKYNYYEYEFINPSMNNIVSGSNGLFVHIPIKYKIYMLSLESSSITDRCYSYTGTWNKNNGGMKYSPHSYYNYYTCSLNIENITINENEIIMKILLYSPSGNDKIGFPVNVKFYYYNENNEINYYTKSICWLTKYYYRETRNNYYGSDTSYYYGNDRIYYKDDYIWVYDQETDSYIKNNKRDLNIVT